MARRERSHMVTRKKKPRRRGGRGLTHEHGTGSVEWWTPLWVFEALELKFDFDPCGHKDAFVPAARVITKEENGLVTPWPKGSGWFNPPYNETGAWTDLWVGHTDQGGTGVSLTFSRTGSPWAQILIKEAHGVLFFSRPEPPRRIAFFPGEGQHVSSPGSDSFFSAWGRNEVAALKRLEDQGMGVMR